MKHFFATLFLLLVIILTGFIPRKDFSTLLTFYSFAFATFLYVYIKVKEQHDVLYFCGLGLLARMVSIYFFPTLSDDVYRFFWDGSMIISGINPFEFLPAELTDRTDVSSYLKDKIYPFINSPNYYTIYPPISQAVYALGAYLFPHSVHMASMVMGMVLWFGELGTIYLLLKMLPKAGIHTKHALLYALNPLIILETCGNLHFEGLMVFFFLGSYFFLQRKNYVLFALCFAFSAMTKLFTLSFYPLFVRRMGGLRWILYGLFISVLCACMVYPFFSSAVLDHFSTSLDLYMRKFEFNASFYYVARFIGKQITGYNEIARIGPILALILLVILFCIYLIQYINDRAILYRAMLIMTAYMLLSTIVHPWYLVSVVALSAFTNFKYPLIWSYLIFLSYAAYRTEAYTEEIWLLVIEYLGLAFFILLDFGILFPRIKKEILS